MADNIGEKQLQSGQEPAVVLNAFEINNLHELTWHVVEYTFSGQGNSSHGDVKTLMRDLAKLHQFQADGFVISIDENHVLIPASWKVPDQENFHGFRVARGQERWLRAEELADKEAVAEVLKAALRQFLKLEDVSELGPLWQDFNGFCESPHTLEPIDDIYFCRRFELMPEVLKHHRWVLKVQLSTITVDAHSFAHYYEQGEVTVLRENLGLKRENRETRKGGKTSIGVLHVDASGEARKWELVEPQLIETHAEADPLDQKTLATQTIPCKNFRHTRELPLNEIFLVLDTQITGEQHAETILRTELRTEWFRKVRDAVADVDLFGIKLDLAVDLAMINPQDTTVFNLPALRLKTTKHGEGRLEAPELGSSDALRQRADMRRRLVQENGFLKQTPISPLLAVPKKYGVTRGKRMTNDLNGVLRRQGIEVAISNPFLYENPDDIVKEVERNTYDSVIAVLPEGYKAPRRDNDMHERIKKALGVESQCIHHDKTLHPKLQNVDWSEIKQNREFAKLARRATSNYTQVLNNLLVKKGWIPFLPAEPFHFNVHVGVDVGGKANTHIMSCIGYGFTTADPIFFTQPIDTTLIQAEPIRDKDLFEGLLVAFETVIETLNRYGRKPDFERMLFLKDGDAKGHDTEWQEMDAYRRLHSHLFDQKIVSSTSTWVALEVSKRARFLRQLRRDSLGIHNPLVGTVSFPYEDENIALVSTTGAPYLTQGTAAPLLVKMHAIAGTFNRLEVLRDLIWEADMGFTKLDTGYALPFVLHVADVGALQRARRYDVTGVTV